MQQLYVYLGYVILAFAVMCYGLQLCHKRNGREGFALSPESVSASAHPLLDYPLQPSGKLSNMSSDDLWSYYPVFDNGYAQYTNNVRYWATPNNGKCSPPEFCGTMYSDKSIKALGIAPVPKPISLNSDVRRVNFYGSDPMTCLNNPKPDVANCLYYGHKTNSLYPPPQPMQELY
jgi:hypothetical protein|uniref:Uncharacterized protein n=1 Tax=viral metagenome TaxID=1070528 RepID=A0A6C0M035_9ZZZZ